MDRGLLPGEFHQYPEKSDRCHEGNQHDCPIADIPEHAYRIQLLVRPDARFCSQSGACRLRLRCLSERFLIEASNMNNENSVIDQCDECAGSGENGTYYADGSPRPCGTCR